MKTLRLGDWLELSAMRCKSWAFGALLFVEHGNVHLGVLVGPWSFDVEAWWPVEAEAS
jgi:hypothetical protein